MTRTNPLLKLLTGVALLANLALVHATPMTYNVDLFDNSGSSTPTGSGFFTVDTTGQAPTSSGFCDSLGCLTDFDFTVGTDQWVFGSASASLGFASDAAGIITGYVFQFSSNSNGNTLLIIDNFLFTTAWGIGPLKVISGFRVGSVVTTQVPEPTMLSLLGLSLAGLGWQRKRAQS